MFILQVIELVKGSGIYVNKFEMTNVQNMSKKQTELARAMLKVVFKDEALMTCSRTGRKPKSGNKENVRPGLHKTGMDTILSKTNIYYLY